VNADQVVVKNLANSGKKSVEQVEVAVEGTFLYPLLRGKDVRAFSSAHAIWILLPQDPGNPARGLPEGTLKTRYPKTYSFFYKFKDEIKNCALFKQWFKEGRDPFYSSYNVGAYTFAPYKVLWKEVAKNIQAAVVEGANYVPDHKLVLVGLDSRDEAYYLCAILNSTPVSRFVESYSIQTSISGHIFEYVTIPTFAPDKNDTHRRLAALGKEAHGMDVQQPRPLEDVIADINDVSRGLWNLTSDEMASLNK
jgi:hypothetical protein